MVKLKIKEVKIGQTEKNNRAGLAIKRAILCTGGLDVIRKEA